MGSSSDGNDVYIVGIAILLAAIIISGTVYLGSGAIASSVASVRFTAPAAASGSGSQASSGAAQALPLDVLKTKVEAYLNGNSLLTPGLTASVVSISPYGNYLDSANVSIMNGTQVLGQNTVLVTSDGSTLIIPQAVFNTSQSVPQAANAAANANVQATAPTQEASPPPKAAVARAQVFIMAHCPYGVQFLKAYAPVMDLLGKQANMSVDFVSYSMHGPTEIVDNNVMYCIEQNKSYNFTAYLRCFVVDENSTRCMAATGINPSAIAACSSALNQEYNNTYPNYPEEAAANAQYGVQGSPTFVLNGQQVDVGRSAEDIKEAICSAFTTPPAACNTNLSTFQEAAGPGPIGGGTGDSTGSVNCGS
jgi:hypothetical protein